MDKLLENFTSFEWWLGVVLVGLLINLFSAYLKPVIDKFFAGFITKRREALDKKKKLFDFRVQQLVNSHGDRNTLQLEIINYKVDASVNFLMGIILFIVSLYFRGEWSAWLIVCINTASWVSIFSGYHSLFLGLKNTSILVKVNEILAENKSRKVRESRDQPT